MTPEFAATLRAGDPVLHWPGLREGPGYLVFVDREGVFDLGGTPSIYIRPMGSYSRAAALTHCEVPTGAPQREEASSS